MKIDGRLIASEIKEQLKRKVINFRQKNIIPHLAVILIGKDPNSLIYIRQKQKVGQKIGVKVSIYKFSLPERHKNTSDGVRSTPPRWKGQRKKLYNLVDKLNQDLQVHGIIIQRPIPIKIGTDKLDRLVAPAKDVDGFHPNSPFTPPVALAVFKILKWLYQHITNLHCYHATVHGSNIKDEEMFLEWLGKQKILIIGRGETAGKPIAKTLKKFGIQFRVAHSQTTSLKELCLSSNIIITCVGRPNIVRQHMTIAKTILIGVGLHRKYGKLQADYNQAKIAKKVAYYTPVPGGVGPVNVACLFENLLLATSSFSSTI